MHKVLLIIGDAAEVLDTMYPLHRLREEGYQVLVAAPEKRIYHLVQHDTHPDWDITVESPGYKLASDIAFRDVRPEEYAGMVISGGRAPEYLRYDEDLMRIVRYFFEHKLPVACIFFPRKQRRRRPKIRPTRRSFSAGFPMTGPSQVSTVRKSPSASCAARSSF